MTLVLMLICADSSVHTRRIFKTSEQKHHMRKEICLHARPRAGRMNEMLLHIETYILMLARQPIYRQNRQILQSNSFMTAFARTSVAKLLCTPCTQFGTSNVEVWHHGFRDSSFSITRAKHSDHPFLGKAAQVVAMRLGWMRFARLNGG